MLHICNADIQALDTANGLRDVIFQVESGQVKAIRELYDPKHGSKPKKNTIVTPTVVKWKNIKGTITKREHIYEQLITQFKRDKHRFFNFFTIQDTSRKCKHKNEDEKLQAMRKVVEAIPHCAANVNKERQRQVYLDSSNQFSNEL
jgi:hypothetical protein